MYVEDPQRKEISLVLIKEREMKNLIKDPAK